VPFPATALIMPFEASEAEGAVPCHGVDVGAHRAWVEGRIHLTNGKVVIVGDKYRVRDTKVRA
jgi:hypothetical protein